MSTVLVVEADARAREDLAASIERAGHLVLTCPGPTGPDYTCVGGRTSHCPLAFDADVVVLDLHCASDDMLQGTPGWQLLLLYMSLGKRVVALMGEEDPVRPIGDHQVAVVFRPADGDDVIAAIRSLQPAERSAAERTLRAPCS